MGAVSPFLFHMLTIQAAIQHLGLKRVQLFKISFFFMQSKNLVNKKWWFDDTLLFASIDAFYITYDKTKIHFDIDNYLYKTLRPG